MVVLSNLWQICIIFSNFENIHRTYNYTYFNNSAYDNLIILITLC